jgi:hypothetical protein
MAKVPVYESQLSLQPAAVDPRTAARLGGEIIDVSQGLEGFAEQMKKHQDWLDTNNAEIAMAKTYDDNLTMVHSDEDIGTLKDRLTEKSDRDIDSAAKLIKSPDARSEFVVKAKLRQSREDAHLHSVIYKRQVDAGKASMMEVNNGLVNDYIHAVNPNERASIKQDIIDKTNHAAEMGYIGKAAAQNYLKTNIPHWDNETVKNDIAIDPASAKANLEKGDKGIYKDLDASHRAAFITMAEKVIKRKDSIQKNVARETSQNIEHDLYDKSLLGVNISADIEKNLGRISRTAYKELTANGESAVAPVCKTDDKACGDVINKIMDKNATDAERRSAILKANTDGVLSKADAQRLYNMALVPDHGDVSSMAKRAQASGDKELDFIESQKNKQSAVQKKQGVLSAVWDYFKKWSAPRENSKEEAAKVMMEFNEKVAAQNTKHDGYMGVAKQVINEKNVKDNPKIINNKKQGQLMIDAHGNKAMVYPDGSYDAL